MKRFVQLAVNQSRSFRRTIRYLLEENKLTRLTAAHADEKLAGIAKIFEESLAHPLARKFRRHPLELVYDATGRFSEHSVTLPVLLGDKYVLLPKPFVESHSARQIGDWVNHEFFHHLRQDPSPRRMGNFLNRVRLFFGKASEFEADKFATLLSKDSGAGLKASLAKAAEAEDPLLKQVNEGNWLQRTIKKLRLFRQHPDIFRYPAVSERMEEIERTASQLSTPQGRSYVEAELARRLETERRKLFPHHPDQGNSRA